MVPITKPRSISTSVTRKCCGKVSLVTSSPIAWITSVAGGRMIGLTIPRRGSASQIPITAKTTSVVPRRHPHFCAASELRSGRLVGGDSDNVSDAGDMEETELIGDLQRGLT
jgi:hypothetical protein